MLNTSDTVYHLYATWTNLLSIAFDWSYMHLLVVHKQYFSTNVRKWYVQKTDFQ